MQKLSTISFPPILDTSSGDIIRDFFNPALAASVRYDRGVGFFSASWLRLAAKGMTEFASNSGLARWVTSPILSESDWEALQEGSAARLDETLKMAMEINLQSLRTTLEKDTLSAMAWMVADGILDFKLALPRNKLDQGEFHDKFGIFTDMDDNQVSFNGSYNDSIQGTRNYESIKIFCSWHPVLALLVNADNERFERLWSNNDPNVQVYDLPEAARAGILKLRSDERPYPEPNRDQLQLRLNEKSNTPSYGVIKPQVPPEITIRDYQNQAIEEWFAHDCQGLLEMATGTGKTITALENTNILQQQRDRIERELKQRRTEMEEVVSIIRDLATSGYFVVAESAIKKAILLLEEKRSKGEIPSDFRQQFIKDLVNNMVCVCGRPFADGSEETRAHPVARY